MAHKILGLVAAPPHAVVLYRDPATAPGYAVEPVLALALVQVAAGTDVVALALGGGSVEFADASPDYLGTYWAAGPELREATAGLAALYEAQQKKKA